MADVADVSPSSGDAPWGASGDPAYADRTLDPSDEWLVGRIAEADPSAVGALYDRYHRVAYSVARRMCGDDVLAGEIVKDAFLAVWRDPALVDPHRGGFGARLLALVHGRALQEGGPSRDRAGLAEKGMPDWGSLDGGVAASPLGGQDVAGQVASALRGLPSESRLSLALAYFGGYTQPEIASIVGASSRTVRSRMFNAVQRLRALLLPRQWGPGQSVRTVP